MIQGEVLNSTTLDLQAEEHIQAVLINSITGATRQDCECPEADQSCFPSRDVHLIR